MVRMRRVSVTAFKMASRSMGLMVCMLTTRTERPSVSASTRAAFIACNTAMPQQMMVRSVPSRMVMALPIS